MISTKICITLIATFLIFLFFIPFFLIFSQADGAELHNKSYRELIKTYDIEEDLLYLITPNDQLLVGVRTLAEELWADIEWEPTQQKMVFTYNEKILGKAIEKTIISFFIINEEEHWNCKVYVQQGNVESIYPYYLAQCKLMDGIFFAPIQCMLEPFFEVVLEMDTMQVHLYDNPVFHRTKILPSQALIISNYEVFEVNYKKNNNNETPLYIGLNDFFQSIATDVVFKLQPPRLIYTSDFHLKAFVVDLIDHSMHILYYNEDEQKKIPIKLDYELHIDDLQPYLALPDLIAILHAQKHCFEDSDIATYLTFEW